MRPQRPMWLPFQNWTDARDSALTIAHMAVCVWLYVINGGVLFLIAAVISGLAIAITVAFIAFRWWVDHIWDEIDDEWDARSNGLCANPDCGQSRYHLGVCD